MAGIEQDVPKNPHNNLNEKDIDQILKICSQSLGFLEKSNELELSIIKMHEEAKVKIYELTNENEKLLLENNKLKDFYEETIKSKKILTQENVKLNNIIEDLNKENQNLKNSLHDAILLKCKTCDTLYAELDEHAKYKENIEQKLKKIYDKSIDIEKEFKNCIIELQDNDKTINSLTQDLQDCKNELAETKNYYTHYVETLKLAIKRKNNDLKKLNKNNNFYPGYIETLKRIINEKNNEIKILKIDKYMENCNFCCKNEKNKLMEKLQNSIHVYEPFFCPQI